MAVSEPVYTHFVLRPPADTPAAAWATSAATAVARVPRATRTEGGGGGGVLRSVALGRRAGISGLAAVRAATPWNRSAACGVIG
jgi:hypothetical protein